jgi:hypothetical protein
VGCRPCKLFQRSVREYIYTSLRCATTHKTAIFILTAVRTSNRTWFYVFGFKSFYLRVVDGCLIFTLSSVALHYITIHYCISLYITLEYYTILYIPTIYCCSNCFIFVQNVRIYPLCFFNDLPLHFVPHLKIEVASLHPHPVTEPNMAHGVSCVVEKQYRRQFSVRVAPSRDTIYRLIKLRFTPGTHLT